MCCLHDVGLLQEGATLVAPGAAVMEGSVWRALLIAPLDDGIRCDVRPPQQDGSSFGFSRRALLLAPLNDTVRFDVCPSYDDDVSCDETSPQPLLAIPSAALKATLNEASNAPSLRRGARPSRTDGASFQEPS